MIALLVDPIRNRHSHVGHLKPLAERPGETFQQGPGRARRVLWRCWIVSGLSATWPWSAGAVADRAGEAVPRRSGFLRGKATISADLKAYFKAEIE